MQVAPHRESRSATAPIHSTTCRARRVWRRRHGAASQRRLRCVPGLPRRCRSGTMPSVRYTDGIAPPVSEPPHRPPHPAFAGSSSSCHAARSPSWLLASRPLAHPRRRDGRRQRLACHPLVAQPSKLRIRDQPVSTRKTGSVTCLAGATAMGRSPLAPTGRIFVVDHPNSPGVSSEATVTGSRCG